MGNDIPVDHKYYGFRIYKIIKDGPIDRVKSLVELEDFILPPEKCDKALDFTKFLHKKKGVQIKLNVI